MPNKEECVDIICSRCHESCHSNNVQVDCNGKTLCYDCADTQHVRICAACNKFKSLNNRWGFVIDLGKVCPTCLTKYKFCSICDRYDTELFDSPDERKICKHCLQCRVKVCAHCNKTVWEMGGISWDDVFYCERCVPEIFIDCNRCHNRFMMNTSHCENDTWYCAECYPVRDITIHPHSYKPTWNMCGANPTRLFFGVELEVECKDINKSLRVVGVEKGDRIIKHDGSIRHGFEIVSAPCTLRYHQRKFGWGKLCKALKTLKCTSDNKTCGLHVHMTKTFSKMEELRFSTFMYHHIDFLRVLSRRDENHFAQLPNDIWTRIQKRKEVKGERYELINWVNENTVEFRLPKGTLRPEVILATVEFCDAVIFYTRGKSLIQIKKEDIGDFLLWLFKSGKDNRRRYMHLIAFCMKYKAAIADPSKRNISKKRGRPVGSRNSNGDIFQAIYSSHPTIPYECSVTPDVIIPNPPAGLRRPGIEVPGISLAERALRATFAEQQANVLESMNPNEAVDYESLYRSVFIPPVIPSADARGQTFYAQLRAQLNGTIGINPPEQNEDGELVDSVSQDYERQLRSYFSGQGIRPAAEVFTAIPPEERARIFNETHRERAASGSYVISTAIESTLIND